METTEVLLAHPRDDGTQFIRFEVPGTTIEHLGESLIVRNHRGNIVLSAHRRQVIYARKSAARMDVSDDPATFSEGSD